MTMMAQTMPQPTPTPESSPSGQLVATDGRTLPLKATAITATARGGIARVTLTQQFVNPYDEPLEVRYQVPLPADGAVSGFAFQLGDQRIVGEVDEKKKARARYESAIVEGRSAALLEQERSSLFTQHVGNIPPQGAITAEIEIDQKLRWLAEGSWEWRFPTVVAPRFSGAPGRVRDVAKLKVDVAQDELDVRAELALTIEDAVQSAVESPSHSIVEREVRGGQEVSLRAGEARLDRDVVMRWPVALDHASADVSVARGVDDDAYGLLTIVPPTASVDDVSRDLVLLIDTSGSMHGEPLAQARRVCMALVDSLGDDDRLEMIEFSWRPSRWKRGSVAATAANKKSARKWLKNLEANGGTQMREGILEALRPLRPGAQRQVVIISDGLIGFEQEIVREIADRLPRGSRVHTVGVGSGVNRSLTAPAARAGRGVEAIIGIGEDAERAAARLVAHTAQPVLVDVEVSGDALVEHAPARIPDLLRGAPALVALRLAPEGGTLLVRGSTPTGSWQQRIDVPAPEPDTGHEGIAPLFARERVEDLEIRRAAGEPSGPIDEEVTALGLAYQIATRLTSWVAIAESPTVDPTAPTRKETMPHELPYGMSVQKLGLRGAPAQVFPMAPMATRARVSQAIAPPAAAAPAGPPGGPPMKGGFGGRFDEFDDADDGLGAADEEVESAAYAPAPAKERKLEAPTRRRKQKAGLGRRIADGLKKMFGARALEGTIVILEDGRLVVSVTAPDGLAWGPTSVVLVLDDGSEIEVELIAELTTRATTATAGQVLRLALRWTTGPLAAKPRSIQVTGSTTSFTIAL